jgi:hypothetical protein
MGRYDSGEPDDPADGRVGDPVEVMADSTDPKSDNVIQMTPALTGAGNSRVLSKEDFEALDKLISTERASTLMAGEALIELERIQKISASAAEKAVKARADRDQFCIGMEVKYDVPKGVRWAFDYAKKAIIISPPPRS